MIQIVTKLLEVQLLSTRLDLGTATLSGVAADLAVWLRLCSTCFVFSFL